MTCPYILWENESMTIKREKTFIIWAYNERERKTYERVIYEKNWTWKDPYCCLLLESKNWESDERRTRKRICPGDERESMSISKQTEKERTRKTKRENERGKRKRANENERGEKEKERERERENELMQKETIENENASERKRTYIIS